MRWALSRVLGGVAAVLSLQLLTASALEAQATNGTVRGRVVESGSNRGVSDAQVVVDGTTLRALTNASGEFTITNVTPGSRSVTARRIGFSPASQTVMVAAGQTATITITLGEAASQLDAVVVTALGETAERRSLGTSQQTVQGAAVAEAQRENFINALQGRIAGVEVSSTSGVPGASTQIVLRGVTSISGNNSPLFIIDGLPMDNKTLHTSVLASSFGGSTVSFENRGVDFTNRGADINPEDIETITVLKGPEAAALYGIDAANGAIIITTKRGTAGGGFEYNNSFRLESTRLAPKIQQKYGISGVGSQSLLYWGPQYAEGTQFYDNVDGFFETALTQRHNLTFSGAAQDNRVNYRVTGGAVKQSGVIPNSKYDRYNVTAAGQSQVTPWMHVDLTTQYSYTENSMPFKGAGGPLLGLLIWPQTDKAADWLTPAGTRRQIAMLASGSEVDNPYFNVNKNHNQTTNNRLILNLGLRFTPFSWGNIKTNLGSDGYANHTQVLRHPESQYGFSNGGMIDVANDNTRNLTAQTVLNVNRIALTDKIGVNALVGQFVGDFHTEVDALWGRDFLEPNFVSINNASVRTAKTTIARRRLASVYGQATLDFNDYLFVNLTGRNDWTSTIPAGRNSFFYPGISTSFVFSDAFPAVGEFMTGKLRAAYAQVGKDARPYAYRPFLVNKTTSYGGYGYDFWGPNVNLRPEFAHSYEIGTELGFLDDRLGLDVTVYRKQTEDQIVNDIRGSYASGFILFNLNGAETRAQGLEVTLRGTPLARNKFTWDFVANFDKSESKVLSLPAELPESYNSDTWLYGNIRNGTGPGLSTRSISGQFYLRNKDGELLINPTTGLPERSTTFIDAGYDRHPDFTVGVTNTLTYGPARLSFLVDIRKGGDIFNATEHYLTARGLSERTLDRETPRIIPGVLRDGNENTANPTRNNIVVVPAVNNGYYLSASEEQYIEKDINWLRLREVTVDYRLPARFGRTSLFVTGTDLLIFTNYSGLDPVVNGTTAATTGSGAYGVDYGNFPTPRGLNFGIRTAF